MSASRIASSPKLLWTTALVLSLVLSIMAALRGGYIGPDYNTHMDRLVNWSEIFDFSTTSPPSYYLLGHLLFRVIGSNNAFPISLSIIQAAINCLALWWFFEYTQHRFRSPLIHLGLVFFATFLPAQVIHATTIGTDWATVPLFVLSLFLFDKFLAHDPAKPQHAALLGFGLTVAIAFKYSFMALLPALFVLFVCFAWTRRWHVPRFIAISILALLLPSAFSLCTFLASRPVHGYLTEKHWLQKGMPPDMNYKDLLLVKSADLRLFAAPEYFKRDILRAHQHSYLGLLQLGIFSDTMNLFQKLSVPQRFGDVLIPDQKTRLPWKTPVMQTSMSLGIVWTILVLIATPVSVFRAVAHLLANKFQREDAAVIFGIAYFLLIFLPIPFVHGGALFGYWTPRLILPSLLCFALAGFLFLDRNIVKKSSKGAAAVLAFIFLQCMTEIVMLV